MPSKDGGKKSLKDMGASFWKVKPSMVKTPIPGERVQETQRSTCENAIFMQSCLHRRHRAIPARKQQHHDGEGQLALPQVVEAEVILPAEAVTVNSS